MREKGSEATKGTGIGEEPIGALVERARSLGELEPESEGDWNLLSDWLADGGLVAAAVLRAAIDELARDPKWTAWHLAGLVREFESGTRCATGGAAVAAGAARRPGRVAVGRRRANP